MPQGPLGEHELRDLCEKRIELGVDPFDDDLVQLEVQLPIGVRCIQPLLPSGLRAVCRTQHGRGCNGHRCHYGGRPGEPGGHRGGWGTKLERFVGGDLHSVGWQRCFHVVGSFRILKYVLIDLLVKVVGILLSILSVGNPIGAVDARRFRGGRHEVLGTAADVRATELGRPVSHRSPGFTLGVDSGLGESRHVTAIVTARVCLNSSVHPQGESGIGSPE
mmetsp:Transcript_88709/g.141232  ORF Transcript_88709/g.141232 Transcript_88709/m.141232 type:complete len:219 (-) Transcript_88709:187-843(-)